MTRTLSTAIDTAVQQETLYLAYLLELQFDSGTEYFWTGAGDLSWNGQTWTGAGDLGSIGGMFEKTDFTTNSIEVSLSHIETSALADLVNEFTNLDPMGRGFVIYMAFFTEAGAINDVLTMTSGDIDGSTFTDGASGQLLISLASDVNKLNRNRYKTYSAQDQEGMFAGDTGCRFVTDLDDEILWGSAPPKSIPSGGGGSGSGGGGLDADSSRNFHIV